MEYFRTDRDIILAEEGFKLSSVDCQDSAGAYCFCTTPPPLGPYRIINVLDAATAKVKEIFCTALFISLHYEICSPRGKA